MNSARETTNAYLADYMSTHSRMLGLHERQAREDDDIEGLAWLLACGMIWTLVLVVWVAA